MSRPPWSVWAPQASTVELEACGRRHRMHRDDDGWWSPADPAAPGHDVDYRFVVDGTVHPDPRSPWQPTGVHGPSRRDRPGAFPWTDGGWRGRPLADSVLYEMHVGTFSPEGTFDGAVARLDHLVDLGVDAVEVMPVAEFPGSRGWGYDGVDLYAPHHAYGGPDGLRRLVDACHARGLAVVLDVVYNHLGPDGNHLRAFGPYFTDRHRTPWGEALNLDGPGSDEVRAYIVDNARHWLLDHHVDGLRLDAVHAIVDTSATHLLEELAAAVREVERETGRTRWVIAESDRNDPRVVRDVAVGGYGLDAAWNDDFHHALHAALTGEDDGYYADFGRLADIATALRRVYVYGGRRSAFRGRRHGRAATGLPGIRFVGYLQNHDQVGNRAGGERSAALVGDGLLRAGAALVLLAPFVPLLFAGEEWGATTPFLYFTDHSDAALAAAVRDGRRREFAAFGWSEEQVADPQDTATFERSRLDWSEVTREPHASLLRWHRDLIALRRSRPDLRDGDMSAVDVDVDETARTLVMRRGGVTVACNLGPAVAGVAVPDGASVALTSGDPPVRRGGALRLPPQSATILVTRP